VHCMTIQTYLSKKFFHFSWPLTGVSSGIERKGNRVSRKQKKEEITSRFQMSSGTPPANNLVTPVVASIPHLQQNQSTVYRQPIDTCKLPNSFNCSPYHNSGHNYHTPTNQVPVPHTVCGIQATGFHMPSVSYNANRGPILATHNWLPPQTSFPSQNWIYPQSHGVTQQSQPHPQSCGISQAQNSEFHLCFRIGNISVCNGCKNRFDKNATPSEWIMYSTWRMETIYITRLRATKSRYGNAYYHAIPSCIINKWPDFHPDFLVVLPAVLDKLTDEHKVTVSSLFGIDLTWFDVMLWHVT